MSGGIRQEENKKQPARKWPKSVIEPSLEVTENSWIVSVLNPDESTTEAKSGNRAILVVEGLYRKKSDSLYLTPFIDAYDISTINEESKRQYIISPFEGRTLIQQPSKKAYHLYPHRSYPTTNGMGVRNMIRAIQEDARHYNRVKSEEYEQAEDDNLLSQIGLSKDCADCCIKYLRQVIPDIEGSKYRDRIRRTHEIIHRSLLNFVLPFWSTIAGIVVMVLIAALFYPTVLTAFTLPAATPAFFAVTLPWLGIGLTGAVGGFLVGMLIIASLELIFPVNSTKFRLSLFWGLQILGLGIGPILAASFLPNLLTIFATTTASTVFPWIFLSLASWVLTLLLISCTFIIVSGIEHLKTSPSNVYSSEKYPAEPVSNFQPRADGFSPQQRAKPDNLSPDLAPDAAPKPPTTSVEK